MKDDQRAFNLVLKYGLHLTWNKNPFLRSSFREVIVGSIMKPPMQVKSSEVYRRKHTRKRRAQKEMET